MPLRAPSLLVPRNLAPSLHHPCSNVFSKPFAQHGWKNRAHWEELIRRHSSFSLAVSAAASSAEFRSPESPPPLHFLARQVFAQESRNEPVYLKGESGASKESVEPCRSFLRKVVRILVLLLLGVGAFFTLRFPALANPERGVPGVRVAGTVTSGRLFQILSSSWAGLVAGCLHTLTGPDHLAALAPLCIGRARAESALIGALWGCGHDAGQVIFGLVFLMLKGRLHIELVRTWSARVVGVTLLAIGAVGLKEAQEVPVSVLAGGGTSTSADSGAAVESTNRLRTFATGVVYGLQPDALIMILPALALPSRVAGAAYLGMFLMGTVIAMGSYTAFIGSCGQALEKRLPWITRRLTIGSSLVAIAFGIGVLLGEFFGIYFF